jgi:hypothetical protein
MGMGLKFHEEAYLGAQKRQAKNHVLFTSSLSWNNLKQAYQFHPFFLL